MPKAETRERGLYRNGNLWWVRVRGPISRVVKPRSTGYAELKDANRVARKLQELAENRPQWPWLERVVAGEVELRRVYDHAAAGSLDTLRAELEAATLATADGDVEPWVTKWETEHLALLSISATQKADYVRQVRALIPAGTPFPRSKFTEDTVKATLLGLKDARSGKPLSGSTRRRYLVAWQLFFEYAEDRVPLEVNPFRRVKRWRPENGSSRSIFWDHDTRIAVIERMTNAEARAAVALTLGSGIELGALLALTNADVGRDSERTVKAHGTKNEHREERTIFVDKWAWTQFQACRRLGLPKAKVFALSEAEIRQNFYEAQVAAGLIEEPPVSESYKKLWKAVKPHTIHDARHTYVVNRLLGLDGEPKQDLKYCATQLGHADEQMVMKIYSKANIRERLRLIELAEAKRQGAQEAQQR